MATWTSDELNKIGTAEELQIASLRQDGTLTKLVIIWVVHLSDDLYVRSVNGRNSAWFRSTQVRHEGHIQADRGLLQHLAFKGGTAIRKFKSLPTKLIQVISQYK